MKWPCLVMTGGPQLCHDLVMPLLSSWSWSSQRTLHKMYKAFFNSISVDVFFSYKVLVVFLVVFSSSCDMQAKREMRKERKWISCFFIFILLYFILCRRASQRVEKDPTMSHYYCSQPYVRKLNIFGRRRIQLWKTNNGGTSAGEREGLGVGWTDLDLDSLSSAPSSEKRTMEWIERLLLGIGWM